METAADYETFKRAYRQHSAFVWGIVLRFVENEAVAEEVMKDVFVRMYADGLCRPESADRERVARVAYRVILERLGRERFRKMWKMGKEPLEGVS